jgi:hypothetical protein
LRERTLKSLVEDFEVLIESSDVQAP